MNLSMVQQGGMHVGCYDSWYETEIDVYRIEHGGRAYCERDLKQIAEFLNNIDYEAYTITKFLMKQGKYESLGEFKGF